jgi:hypothetical protein
MDGSIDFDEINLVKNLPALIALIISLVLGIYIGGILIFMAIYGIDYLYINIVEHVANVFLYS